jgi:putative spermidine/putrescine transport system ATP-binding protein
VRLAGDLALAVAAADPPAGAAVLCLIRPEAVHLSAVGDAAGPNRFAATLAGAVYLGGRYDCEVALAGGHGLRAEMPASGGAVPPKPGDPVSVLIHPEDVIVLPEAEPAARAQ